MMLEQNEYMFWVDNDGKDLYVGRPILTQKLAAMIKNYI